MNLLGVTLPPRGALMDVNCTPGSSLLGGRDGLFIVFYIYSKGYNVLLQLCSSGQQREGREERWCCVFYNPSSQPKNSPVLFSFIYMCKFYLI